MQNNKMDVALQFFKEYSLINQRLKKLITTKLKKNVNYSKKKLIGNLHEIYVPIVIYVVIPIVLIFLEMYETTFVSVILVSFSTAKQTEID